MKIQINSKVEHGRLTRNRKALQQAIEQYEGKDITITIDRKKKSRTTHQNRYYWGVIIPLIQAAILTEWGERKSKEEIHEFLKIRFNFTEHHNTDTGEIVHIGRGTSSNTTVQQEEYHDDCRIFAKEWFNITIPMPNEEMEINFES